MESLPNGGSLTSHLTATRQAVLDWLEYENPLEEQAGQDDYLLRLALEEGDDLIELTKPDMPEILQLLRESRVLNIPIYSGSLMELPYVFHMELTTCLSAEAEFRQTREANRLAWEKWRNANQSKPQPTV